MTPDDLAELVNSMDSEVSQFLVVRTHELFAAWMDATFPGKDIAYWNGERVSIFGVPVKEHRNAPESGEVVIFNAEEFAR